MSRAKDRLRASENRVLETDRNKVIGGWREVHNKEFHNWYPLPNIIRMIKSRMMRGVGGVTYGSHGEVKNAYNILVGKSEEKILLRTPTYGWQNNIKMNLRETMWTGSFG
jgi:hypothetical protein